MSLFISSFILAVLSFYLFYFSVPYFTGMEMCDVSKNGIYRLAYMLCSSVGWYVYKGIEIVNRKLSEFLHFKPGGIPHGVINAIMYTGVVYAFSSVYDTISSIILNGESADISLDVSSSYAKLSDLLAFITVARNFGEVSNIGEFFKVLGNSIVGVAIFLVITVLYFSFMYGLLSQKVKELHLVDNWVAKHPAPRKNSDVEEIKREDTVLEKILDSLLDFVDKLSIFRNFMILGVQFAFLGIIALYSLVKTISGSTPDWNSFALDLLDESGIVSTIGSFIVSFLVGKLMSLCGIALVKVLPERTRERLQVVSEKCNQVVTSIKNTRDAWSSKFDSVYQRTQHWVGVYRTVQEMHLD